MQRMQEIVDDMNEGSATSFLRALDRRRFINKVNVQFPIDSQARAAFERVPRSPYESLEFESWASPDDGRNESWSVDRFPVFGGQRPCGDPQAPAGLPNLPTSIMESG